MQESTGDTIGAREYADQVLYPFSSYCREKIIQFWNLFEPIITSASSDVRETGNQISSFSLKKNNSEDWPENAISISATISFLLKEFQGIQKDSFSFIIKNEVNSNICIWNFYSSNLDYKKEYTGQDLVELKKIFNEMIRFMMRKLSEQSENGT